MFDNKEALKKMILQYWDLVKNAEKSGTSAEVWKKQLKEYEDLYRYHYEGGNRPAHLPTSSNNLWVGCHNCDWERQLNDNERESEDSIATGCPNNCNKSHYFYPSTERKIRNKSNSWLDSYKGSNDVGGGVENPLQMEKAMCCGLFWQ